MILRRCSFWLMLAFAWCVAFTLLHQWFSLELYLPVKEALGQKNTEYLCGALFVLGCAALGWLGWHCSLLCQEWGLWLLVVALGFVFWASLMVTNIELIHYPQYMLLVIMLRFAGLHESTCWALGLTASLVDESWQYLFYPRFTGYMDWNDLLINMVGLALGLLLTRCLAIYPRLWEKTLRMALALFLVFLLMGGFFAWLAGVLVLYHPLDPGVEPHVLVAMEKGKALALALNTKPDLFWQPVSASRYFHRMGVLEGIALSLILATLLARLLTRGTRNKFPLLLAFACFLGMAQISAAQNLNTEPFTFSANFTHDSIMIDGKFSEEAWQKTSWQSNFMDMVDGSAPWFATESALLWDDENLYVAARLVEPWVEGRITQKDAEVYKDGDFEFFFSGPDAYWELEVNALGTVYDVFWIWHDALGTSFPRDVWNPSGRHTLNLDGIGSHKHPRGMRTGFIDLDLDADVRVQVQGSVNENLYPDAMWTVEIAIPWSRLAMVLTEGIFPPKNGDTWPINLSRFVFRTVDGERLSEYSPAGWTLTQHGAFDSHMPEKYGLARFIKAPAW